MSEESCHPEKGTLCRPEPTATFALKSINALACLQEAQIRCRDLSMQTVPPIFEARFDVALLPSALHVAERILASVNGFACLLAFSDATPLPAVQTNISIPFHVTCCPAHQMKKIAPLKASQATQNGCRDLFMQTVRPICVAGSDSALLPTALCVPGMTFACKWHRCLLASPPAVRSTLGIPFQVKCSPASWTSKISDVESARVSSVALRCGVSGGSLHDSQLVHGPVPRLPCSLHEIVPCLATPTF